MIETNSIKAWYLAARPKTLTAAAVPVLLGIALAYKDAQQIQTLPALLCLLFAWVMQIDSNLVNDYSTSNMVMTMKPDWDRNEPALKAGLLWEP